MDPHAHESVSGLEARLFARYLVGSEPPARLADRYGEAVRIRLGGEDDSLTRFVRDHPWSLPWLDAASAVLAPRSVLRKKLLILSAVLECSTEYVPCFLPRRSGSAGLFLLVASQGLLAGIRLLLGIPLYLIARRTP